jgi:hypothetical protein
MVLTHIKQRRQGGTTGLSKVNRLRGLAVQSDVTTQGDVQ